MMVETDLIKIIANTLNLSIDGINNSSKLFGHMPEFDSQAVLGILTEIEKHFGIYFEDDDISAEIFESIKTLSDFVKRKL